MGLQGPLTAQALGRSPYEASAGPDEAQRDGTRGDGQAYDEKGRPVNPETKKINRDLIRAHNEVMLVIGVAETDHPAASSEAKSRSSHQASEETVGLQLATVSRNIAESVGFLGIHGLRQRVMVYKRYSEIPFYQLYRQARQDFSFSRDIFAGLPASLLIQYADLSLKRLDWFSRDRKVARRCVNEVWGYLRVHLQLFVAFQRLGLISERSWLPSPWFFIPFSSESPIPSTRLPDDLSPASIASWVGQVFVSTTPFFVWVMTQRIIVDWKADIWMRLFRRLPTTFVGAGSLMMPHGEASTDDTTPDNTDDGMEPSAQPSHASQGQPSASAGERQTRQNEESHNDDFASDDDDPISATLISFDVEATTDTVDIPQGGVWSAELRPSMPLDPRATEKQPPVYLDTLLTRLPSLMAAAVLSDVATIIVTAPYETTALRLTSRLFRLTRGLPCTDIHNVNLLSGLNWTSTINFLAVELLHLSVLSEIWAVFTGLSQYLHKSKEEWEEAEKTASRS